MVLTTVYEQVSASEGDGYVACVDELPEAISEGDALDEARESLRDAIELLLEANRRLTEKRIPARTQHGKELQSPCLVVLPQGLTIILTIDKIMTMEDISISEFKAKCLGLIEQVHKTRQPLRITRHGRPVAEVIPAGPDRKRKFLGDMLGTVEIIGDIVSPVIDLKDIEAYHD